MTRVVELERWLTKQELASFLGCGTRFLEYRMTEGMPSAMIAGRVKFKASEVERWLEDHGHLERRAG